MGWEIKFVCCCCCYAKIFPEDNFHQREVTKVWSDYKYISSTLLCGSHGRIIHRNRVLSTKKKQENALLAEAMRSFGPEQQVLPEAGKFLTLTGASPWAGVTLLSLQRGDQALVRNTETLNWMLCQINYLLCLYSYSIISDPRKAVTEGLSYLW